MKFDFCFVTNLRSIGGHVECMHVWHVYMYDMCTCMTCVKQDRDQILQRPVHELRSELSATWSLRWQTCWWCPSSPSRESVSGCWWNCCCHSAQEPLSATLRGSPKYSSSVVESSFPGLSFVGYTANVTQRSMSNWLFQTNMYMECGPTWQFTWVGDELRL